MSARQTRGPYDSVARKWLALAKWRKLHFIELYDSGRWRRYYTEAQLLDEMRETTRACDEWARIVGAESPIDLGFESGVEGQLPARAAA